MILYNVTVATDEGQNDLFWELIEEPKIVEYEEHLTIVAGKGRAIVMKSNLLWIRVDAIEKKDGE